MGQALLWRHWLASGVASVRIMDVADIHVPQNTWPHMVEYRVLPADNSENKGLVFSTNKQTIYLNF